MSNIANLINTIQTDFENGEFDKFIHEMNFPNFKNFSPFTKIEFRFPITVVVGPNGGGKSSILHAAWGMPHKYSTSRFWFSTHVDPITPADNPRYWYSHYIKALNINVQSRKMYGTKRRGYWEPTRPAQREGMAAMPPQTKMNSIYMSATGDRWTPVDRAPHYFNAKSDISAFDRFFNSTAPSSLESRQNYFIRYSKKLKEVIDGPLQSMDYYGVERVSQNFILSAVQLASVNKILQKKYKSARYISHKLYDKEYFSPSVIFETASRSYSECFAGSGELAVVNLVLALEKLNKFDLLLLDEPETSLHPGAQARLIEHILDITSKKRVQVIISTHSPTFVENLPPQALVVLEETDTGTRPRADPTKSSAFSRLGQVDKDKITILTEDRLLKALTDCAVLRLEKHLRDKIIVTAVEVGASEMLSNQTRAHIQANTKVLMIFDGDQSPVRDIYNGDPSDLSDNATSATIANLKKLNVSIVGSKADLAGWMRWCKDHAILIDQVCPERVLLELLEPTHALLANNNATNSQCKDAVRSALSKRKLERTSDAQYHIFKLKLQEMIKGCNADKTIDDLRVKLIAALVQFD
ncbi:TPA: AAA family ATPase [Burkholderia vietnamiensis]|nr:AAA family ATPase [Burkholderia vietnamiensis]HDR9185862.1 AAA family ATPase [Burkholderia vietnamiensis]